MTDWSQFTPIEEEPESSGIDWSQFEPIADPKRELPAGVKASDAGGGRGSANFAATDPRRVDVERPKTRLVGSTRGGFRPEEVKPRAGSGPSVLDRVPEEVQARLAAEQPLTDAQLVELQKSPALREREAAALREKARQQSVTMTEAPERGVVQRLLDKTIRKPEQRGLGDLLVEGAGDAARGVARAGAGVASSMWSGIQAGAEVVGAGDSDVARLAGEAGRAGRATRTQWGNPSDPDSLTQQVFESTFTTVPAMVALGGGNLALAAMGAQSAANDYGESRDAGKTHDEAAGRAAYMGIAEVIGERFGLPELGRMFRLKAADVAADKLPGLLKDTITLIGKEQVGEQVTQALQSAYEKWGEQGRRPDMTLDDYLRDAAETAKVTLGQSLLTGGAAGVARRMAPAPTREEEFARAFAADTADTRFMPGGAEEFARAAMSPNSEVVDPGLVSPAATVRSVVPVAPRIEEQPEEVRSPEELQAMAQQAAAQRAAAQPAAPEQPGAQAPAAPTVALPPRTTGDIGIATVPAGQLAAAAEQQIKKHAQEAATNASVPDAPVARPGERGAAGGADAGGSVVDPGRVADQPGARPADAGAPVAGDGQAGLLRAGADRQQAALTPGGATIAVDAQANTPVTPPAPQGSGAGRPDVQPPQSAAAPIEGASAAGGGATQGGQGNQAPVPPVGRGVLADGMGGAQGTQGDRRSRRQGVLDAHVATLQRSANDDRLKARALRAQGNEAGALALEGAAERKQAHIDSLESALDHPDIAGFEPVADILEEKFGRAVVPYVDTSDTAADGFSDGDAVFVNLANPQKSVAFTAVHELQHVIRRQAERGNARAQNATRLLDQVWAMVSEEHKRAYAEQFLFAGHGKTYEAIMADEKLAGLLRDEVMSDFMGGRAADAQFWRDLARKNPQTFGDFVRSWISTLKELIAALRGSGIPSINNIDPAIKNLEAAKRVAERVFAEWVALNPKLASSQAADSPAADEPVASRRRTVPVEEFDAADKDVPEYVSIDQQMSDMDEFDGMELGEVVVADDAMGELSDAELEIVQAELSEALGLAQLPDQAPVTVYPSPDDKALKKAGIMAEDAYEPIPYTEVAMRDADGEVWGSKQEAQLQIGDNPWSSWGFSVTSNDAGVTFASHTPLGKLKGIGAGAPWGLSKVSEQVAKDWNRRVAASVDLLRRKFDLAKTVPPAARKRVVQTWRELATRPGAFEFGLRAKIDRNAPTMQKLQQIADSLLDGTRYVASAGNGGASNWWTLTLQDKRTGAVSTGNIEYVNGADRRLVLHASDFDQGSGLGKPFYQVALAFSHEVGIPTNADPSGLLGVNNYRRTDQSFSAALRAGFSSQVNPGIGQRVYGWEKGAKTDAQHDSNLLRLALAQARNVAEFIPRVRELSYDLAADKFAWRKGKEAGQDAEAWVGRQLASQDVRRVSISRSTIARAAVTFQAVDGQVDVPDELTVAAPVLYSRRGGFFPEAEADSGYAALERARRDGYNRLANRQLKVPVRLADSGETVELTVDAAKAMARLDERQTLFEELAECLSR
ncbi:MAG: hypothetical protein HY856_13595 [Burkholderiales bacterium]|nr:hypothetical protein [Burkholderiales bacterium]